MGAKAAFYVACVALGLSHLHEKHVIWRDLKLENCLLTSKGYVKLTDMGIAKMVTGKTFTVCGTADYFAPETLKQVGHNRAVDWWALGVMLFIMIAGHSPFDAPEVTQIYKNIIRGLSKVQFPAGFSPEAEECVRSLCRKKPEDRITMQRGGIQNLWALAFFNGMNWEAVQDQTWPPPFVPETDYDKISNRQLSRHVHIVWEGLQPWAPEAEEEPSQSWGSLACILVSPVTSIIMISACARRVALSARAVPAGAAANVSPLAAQTRLLHQSSPRFNQCVNPGYPVMWTLVYDKPAYDPEMELEYDVMPRDEFGVPAHIPPEISTAIRHTYYIPPQYYPFLKKLGDDTPELKPWMDKLINGEMTFDDYEEMFYQFAKPLKIHRPLIPMPYRSAEEVKRTEEVMWEGAWLSFRQRVLGDYISRHHFRDFLGGIGVGLFFAWVYTQQHRQYRIDMKLFYLEAPEHKINWVTPRGDL
ncbi:unnamed protein product [Effrenium voratum]|uniref:Protein kinase domain-containing protein n=1 Tax=Effrenium voratum TaxID=2562239 RepID=A0AA36N0D9_9DINO|nr:unnamed protein product [Effrenium voratum]